MKKYLPLLFMLLTYSASLMAQADTISTTDHKTRHTKPAKPPVCYLGISTGINNPPGFLGLDFNIALGKCVTFDAGVGPSTWGNKFYVGSKYYLKESHRSWALGGGFTYCSGEENINLNLNTVAGYKEKVSLSLKPEDDAFVAIYHYWTLGRKYNRFYIDLGKSVALQPAHFHEKPGTDPLTSQADQRVKNMAPGNFIGGLMIGVGVSFGLYHKTTVSAK